MVHTTQVAIARIIVQQLAGNKQIQVEGKWQVLVAVATKNQVLGSTEM